MFNIGGGELLVIALVALIVLGPQRLPDAARQAGKVLADLRRLSSGFQAELKGAFNDAELDDTTTTRRKALGATPPNDSAVTNAVASVSDQRPKRRTPLQASPADAPDPGAAKKATKRAGKATPKQASPRSGGG